MKKKSSYSLKALEILKKEGLRVSSGRKKILKLLEQSGGAYALSVQEIYDKLNKNKDSIDLVSVYRTMEVFSQLGLVHQDTKAGKFLPCTHLSCHNHSWHLLLECQKCQQFSEVDPPSSLQKAIHTEIEKKLSFHTSAELIKITGLCQKCQKLLA